jgi:hypothetical protein
MERKLSATLIHAVAIVAVFALIDSLTGTAPTTTVAEPTSPLPAVLAQFNPCPNGRCR